MTHAHGSAVTAAAFADLFEDHDALSFLVASLDAGVSNCDSSSERNTMSSTSGSLTGSDVAEANKVAPTQPSGALALNSNCADSLLQEQQQQQLLSLPPGLPMVVEPASTMELVPDLEDFIDEFNLGFAQTAVGVIDHGGTGVLDVGTTSIGFAVGSGTSVSLGQGSGEATNAKLVPNAVNSTGELVGGLMTRGPAEDHPGDGDDEDDGWTLAKKSIGRHSRRREELIYLRDKVRELEAKMDSLKCKRSSSHPQNDSSTPTAQSSNESPSEGSGVSNSTITSTSGSKKGGSMWENVATRQLWERQKAELHNKKLRSALETHLQIAKSLERILKKRNTFEALFESSGPSKRTKHAPGPLGDDNASVFDKLLGDMDHLYADVDRVLEATGLQSETSTFCKIVVKPDAVSGLVMEIIENKLLPAEPSVAYKTMWRLAGEKGVNNSDYFEVKTDTSHDVSKRSFGATFTRGCHRASFRGTQVSKKFLEEKHMVIVSKSIMSSIEDPASPAHGLVFEESTWTVLSLLRNPNLLSEPITRCQTCSVFVPKCWGPNLKPGILTEFVTSSWEKANEASDQLVENMLLEEMSKLQQQNQEAMESSVATHGRRCSLEEQLPSPPCPSIECSEPAPERGSSSLSVCNGQRTVACDRPDSLPASDFAALSPMAQLDDDWMTAEGDILQDLLSVWDAEDFDSAHSGSSDRAESAPAQVLSEKPSSELAISSIETRAPQLMPVRRQSSACKSGIKIVKSSPTTSSARQKLEIQVLRIIAFDLEKKCRCLEEAARIARAKDEECVISSPATRLPSMPQLSLWKTVAETQRERLKKAQRNNQELRLGVLDYKKMAKNLWRALVKRGNRHALLATKLQLPPLQLTRNLDLSSDDRVLFQSMISDTNAMRVGIGNTLKLVETKIPVAHPGSFRIWDVRRDASMVLFAEVIACEQVPFRRVQVENAMRVLRDQKKPGSRRYDAQVFGGSPEVVLTKSHFRYSSPIESGIYRGHEASHAFEDDKRSYAVSIMYVHAIDGLGNAAPGFVCKFQSWMILTEQQHSEQGGESAHPITLIQTCSTLMPVRVREPYPVPWEKEVVEKFVIPVWDQATSGYHQRLENVLLDQACSRVR